MERKLSLLLSIAIIFLMFTGCTQKHNDDPALLLPTDNASHDERVLRCVYSKEVEDWNYLAATSNTPAEYIDSLVEYDYLGIARPCLAESWQRSHNGKIWTFNIRKNVKWMTYDGQEYADTTAHDFVTSAEYILNAKNSSRLANLLFMIEGAEQYYDATNSGLAGDFSQVGVKALNDYTLEYTLTSPLPYFLSSLTYKAFFPANADFIAQCGDSFSTDNKTMLYNGSFIMTDWAPKTGLVASRNPTYWDSEHMFIDRIERTYNADAEALAPQMYLNGEIDQAVIPTDRLDEWLSDPEKANLIHPNRPSFYSYYYMFNFYPNFSAEYQPENWRKAVNNLNFRKSIYHAFDKLNTIRTEEPYNAETHLLNTITPPDFITVDGRDYTRLNALSGISNQSSTYEPEKALEYKSAAITELLAEGATFPVKIYMPYNSGSKTQAVRAEFIEQQWERDLGTDYIDVIIEGYPDNDFSDHTMRSGNYCIMPSMWMADYADPKSYCDPFLIISNATNFIYMADGFSEIAKPGESGAKQGKDGRWYKNIKYDTLVDDASSECLDMSKRYNALAGTEAWLIDSNCFVMPYMRGGVGYTASTLNPFECQYAAFGASDGRYKYQHIMQKGMNTEEYYCEYDRWKQERAQMLNILTSSGKVAGIDY